MKVYEGNKNAFLIVSVAVHEELKISEGVSLNAPSEIVAPLH